MGNTALGLNGFNACQTVLGHTPAPAVDKPRELQQNHMTAQWGDAAYGMTEPITARGV
jgi:hypothetical protein